MYDIRKYTDTKCELQLSKTRLRLLMDRKEKLYCKYFPVTAQLKDVMVDGGEKNKDKMADYLYELHDVIDVGTGKSLADEIEYEQKHIQELQEYLNSMKDTLSTATGIVYQLYYEIVYKGVNITKAVENIAIANEIEPQTIWKYYYPKIKFDIQKLRRFGYNSHIKHRKNADL